MTKTIQAVITDHFHEAQLHDVDVPGLVVGYWDYRNNDAMEYAIGLAEKSGKEPLTVAHSFKIASVTKTMVTTVIAQLIEEGRLSFNSPLSYFYPNLTGADQITIRMLGNMTSGYYDYLSDEEFLDSFDNTPYFKATPNQLIATAMKHGLQYPPGTAFQYSNTNTVLLGQIIEKVTGNALEAEVRKRIFIPLRLSKTGAPLTGSFLPVPRAHSYHPKTKEGWTEKMDYSPEYACGNAYSTLYDLKVWIEALGRGALIKPDTYSALFAEGSPFPNSPEYTYYFGLIDYKGFLGHSGDTDYYLTEAYHSPSRDMTIIILSNTSAAGFTSVLFQKIVEVIESDAPET